MPSKLARISGPRPVLVAGPRPAPQPTRHELRQKGAYAAKAAAGHAERAAEHARLAQEAHELGDAAKAAQHETMAASHRELGKVADAESTAALNAAAQR